MGAAHALRNRRLSNTALAMLGGAVSAYLAVYQYGDAEHVWEPFFGSGSERVLNSGLLDWISRAAGVPIHDALLGAVSYGCEVALLLATFRFGSTAAKWLNVCYSALVLIMGLTSLLLVILQPTVFHAWCTLCLMSAAISEAIVVLSLQDLADSVAVVTQWWKAGRLLKPAK